MKIWNETSAATAASSTLRSRGAIRTRRTTRIHRSAQIRGRRRERSAL